MTKQHFILDTLIRESDKSYTELADGLGVSRETFWRYRREPWRMRGPQLAKLAGLLNMSIEDLYRAIEK